MSFVDMGEGRGRVTLAGILTVAGWGLLSLLGVGVLGFFVVILHLCPWPVWVATDIVVVGLLLIVAGHILEES